MLGVRWERGRLLGRGAHGTVYFARLHDDDTPAGAAAAAADDDSATSPAALGRFRAKLGGHFGEGGDAVAVSHAATAARAGAADDDADADEADAVADAVAAKSDVPSKPLPLRS